MSGEARRRGKKGVVQASLMRERGSTRMLHGYGTGRRLYRKSDELEKGQGTSREREKGRPRSRSRDWLVDASVGSSTIPGLRAAVLCT